MDIYRRHIIRMDFFFTRIDLISRKTILLMHYNNNKLEEKHQVSATRKMIKLYSMYYKFYS